MAVGVDGAVAGHEDAGVVAGGAEGLGEGGDDVAQAAALGVGGAFRGDEQDAEGVGGFHGKQDSGGTGRGQGAKKGGGERRMQSNAADGIRGQSQEPRKSELPRIPSVSRGGKAAGRRRGLQYWKKLLPMNSRMTEVGGTRSVGMTMKLEMNCCRRTASAYSGMDGLISASNGSMKGRRTASS